MLVEFATYPYRKEGLSKLALLSDYLFSLCLSSVIDYIVTFSDFDKIYRVQTIRIQNGIEFDNMNYARNIHGDSSINLLGVANLSIWHGYDRIIKGLKRYYSGNSRTKVHFHIVGEGLESDNLKRLTYDYELQDYVFFIVT